MLKGTAISGGFAIGKILLIEKNQPYFSKCFRGEAKETERFENALERFNARTEAIASRIRSIVGQSEAEIFTGHIFIANDPDIKKQIRQKIAHGFNAEMAAESACDFYIDEFLNSGEELTKLRAADILDVKNSFLHILCERKEFNKIIPFGSVVAARELTPSAVSFLDRRRTVAVITEQGERQAHFAILLRAMGIPAVAGIDKPEKKVKNGEKVLVDGNRGEVIKLNRTR